MLRIIFYKLKESETATSISAIMTRAGATSVSIILFSVLQFLELLFDLLYKVFDHLLVFTVDLVPMVVLHFDIYPCGKQYECNGSNSPKANS